MLCFYGKLSLRALVILWTAADRYVTVFGIASFFVVLSSPELAELATSTWSGFSRWWALLPLGLLFLYGLMKANHEAFRKEEQKSERIRVEKEELEEKLESSALCAALNDLLGEAYEEGYQLSSAEAYEKWTARTRDLIEAAFGKGEARLFLSDAGYTFDSGGLVVPGQAMWTEFRLRRLGELISRVDSLQVRPGFDPRDFTP